MERMLNEITKKYNKTCSIYDLRDNCVTFARDRKYLSLLQNTHYKIGVIVPAIFAPVDNLPNNIEVIFLEEGADIDYYFTFLHNFINKDKDPEPNVIGKNCNIHDTVILDVPGNTYAKSPTGERVMMKHMGNVVIGDNVDIAAYSVIHTSTMASTIIEDGVKICAMCNVGHNSFIGEHTFLAPGVRIAGGTKIGKNCYIWQGVMTRSYVTICDNVAIGMGSVVTKDITEPGIYYGNPCTYRRPYEEILR